MRPASKSVAAHAIYANPNMEEQRIVFPDETLWEESFSKQLWFAIVIVFWLKWAGYSGRLESSYSPICSVFFDFEHLTQTDFLV